MSMHKPERKPNGLDLQFDQMPLKNFQVSVISRGTRPIVAISCESEMWMYGSWDMKEKGSVFWASFILGTHSKKMNLPFKPWDVK